ncbi:hypothetical protein AAVH_02472 [Aphelenchoides avenae]|nr:hypothetical protein AAVH_02472 [Aphelenchus avenae]
MGMISVPSEVFTTAEILDEKASSGYDSPPQQESAGTDGEWVDGLGFVTTAAGKTSDSAVTVDDNRAAKATQVLRVLNEGAGASVTGSESWPGVEEHPSGSVKERSVWSPVMDSPGWVDENGRPLVLTCKKDETVLHDLFCGYYPKCSICRNLGATDPSENEIYKLESEDSDRPPQVATDTSKATKQEDVAAGSAQDYVGSGNISAYNPYKVGPIRYGLYDYIRKYLETYKPKFTTDELKFTVEDGRVLMKIGTSDGDQDETEVLENEDWQEPPSPVNKSSKVKRSELVRVGHRYVNRKLLEVCKPMRPVEAFIEKSPAATKSLTADGRRILAFVARDSKAHRILQILNEGNDQTEFFELQPIRCGPNQRDSSIEKF